LLCSEEDEKRSEEGELVVFDICPDCGSTNIVDYEEDDDADL